MARNGICQVLISDNDPSYSCQAFSDVARDWGFIYYTASPYHPISNGHSEVMVSVAKKILKKAKESKQDPYLLILEYRSSPLPDCNLSPAQLLLSRRIKSEMRSFKSNENIHKKEGGSHYVVSANKASSVTLQSHGNESQRKHTTILEFQIGSRFKD